MRGELRLVIDRAPLEIWEPLLNHRDCPANLYGEIYVTLADYLVEPPEQFERDADGTVRDAAVRIDTRAAQANSDPSEAERLVGALGPDDFESEGDALKAVAAVHETLVDLSGDDFGRAHLDLLRGFIEKFSLRYYVDADATLWMTFPGIAAVIFHELRIAAREHPHLSQELNAFEHALAECLRDPTENRIKTAIQKQFNVMEAFGTRHPAVSGNSLGRMLDQVGTWPHECMPDVGKGLYKFACDYPGIRHAGTFESALRPLDLRDLAGVALSLVGLTPYLSDGFEKGVEDALVSGSDNDAGESVPPWLVTSTALAAS